MANLKVTELGALTTPAAADLLHVIDDVAGTATNKKTEISDLIADFDRTQDEIDALVTPANFLIRPGHESRYTDTSDWLDVGLQGTDLVLDNDVDLSGGFTTKVATARIKITSNGNYTITGASTLRFLNAGGGDIIIHGVKFDDWLEVIENDAADATTTDVLEVVGCEFSTLAGIPINVEGVVNRAWIVRNYITGVSPASGNNAYGIRIGINTFGSQDTWQRFTIRNNVFDGIHATGAGDAAAILVYGRFAEISGNKITDIDSVTGECWGIFTKLRHSVITHNTVDNLVTSGTSLTAITIKGSDRGVSNLGVNGFANVISNNMVLLTDDGNGIRLQVEDALVIGNFVENADKSIVIDQPSTNTPENVEVIGNHILLSTSGSLKYGVTLEGAVSGVKVHGNMIDGQGGTGHCIRVACNDDCSDISITQNTCRGADRGISDNTTSAKVKTGYQINGNQFLTLSGDAIAVNGADNVQIHDNQFESITGDYWDFDATNPPTKLSIKGNAGLTVQTTDGSATNIAINIDVPDETKIWAKIKAVASELNTSDAAVYKQEGLWQRTAAGSLTQIGADIGVSPLEAALAALLAKMDTDFADVTNASTDYAASISLPGGVLYESDATWTGVALVESSNALIPRVTGVAAQTINWTVDFTCKSI